MTKQNQSRRAVTWLDAPEEHDYPAAVDYLNLVADSRLIDTVVDGLRAATTSRHKAKDVLRAAQLPLLPAENVHVAKDLAKVEAGQALSPILMVRGDLGANRPLVIADGYHRLCAAYLCDENTEIPARLADYPA